MYWTWAIVLGTHRIVLSGDDRAGKFSTCVRSAAGGYVYPLKFDNEYEAY